jgi:hypothetical protein
MDSAAWMLPGVAKAARSWRCAVRVLTSIVVLLVIGALLAYTLRRRS